MESWGLPGSQEPREAPNSCKSPCQRAGDETRTRNLLFTRQLRYRLRHASDAGTAYPGWALEDSGTAHECCPLASQQTVLASTQQRGVAAYEVKLPSG